MLNYKMVNTVFVSITFGAGSKKAFPVLLEIKNRDLLDEDLSNPDIIEYLPKILLQKFKLENYDKAESIVKKCELSKISILTVFDDRFPGLLKNIESPPVVLYYVGDLPDFKSKPVVTLIGPREPSKFGLKSAERLAYRFSRAGMIVVAGDSTGCDTATHNGSLTEHGNSLMIIPNGIDSNYHSKYDGIKSEIIKSGCIISEFSPDTSAMKYSFPVRNRLLAGISSATILIEARENSGSLITANWALKFNRTLYAIPGNPSQKDYKGSNKLFSKGAKPLVDINDVFDEYLSLFSDKIDTDKAFSVPVSPVNDNNYKKITKKSKETLSKEAKIVYNYLDSPIFTFDDLADTGLSADDILSALTELELEELIVPLAGGKYKIK